MNIEWMSEFEIKRAYEEQSCLNYRHICDLIEYPDGNHGKNDFDDWANMGFSFFKNTKFDLKQ